MKYLTFSGELLDNFINTFSKIVVGKRFTCKSYSISSCAYETIIKIHLNKKISINVVFQNTYFSSIEINEHKFLIKKVHQVFGLDSKREYNSFNAKSNLNDIVIYLLNLTSKKLEELEIEFKIEGDVGNVGNFPNSDIK